MFRSDANAFRISSSQDTNTLNYHYLVLPANLPHVSDPVKAWKPNIANARFGPSMSYIGCTTIFFFSLSFLVRELVATGNLGYI